MYRAQSLWFAALVVVAACESSSDRDDAGLDVDAGFAEAGASDVSATDASPDALSPGLCGASAARQPCPPQTYATWPMPHPPGVPLPPSASYATADDAVLDRVSGLQWQRGFSPKQSWPDAKTYCDSLVLAGASDWRLPSRIELISLVDYTRLPSIDHEAFPSTADDYFWASSLLASNDQLAFSVYFGAGLTAYGAVAGPSAHARCVRGGNEGFLPRFRMSDTEVYDNNTKLTWQRQVVGQALAWDTAKEICEQQGWRLPSTKELQTIVDETRVAPTADQEVFPNTPAERFWTSSPVNKAGLANAVYVDMLDGSSEEASVVESFRVRCVR